MTTAISKSPAQAIAAALEKKISPDQVATVLFDALAATTVSRSGAVEPDTRSRLQAAGMILAYQVGTPIQRTESVNVNMDADSSVGMEERLMSSPALLSLVESTVAKVRARKMAVDASWPSSPKTANLP